MRFITTWSTRFSSHWSDEIFRMLSPYPIELGPRITAISYAPAYYIISVTFAALSGDTESEFVINQEQAKIRLPRGASDAALTRVGCQFSARLARLVLCSWPWPARTFAAAQTYLLKS